MIAHPLRGRLGAVDPVWLTIYLDLAPEEHAAALAFWEGVTGWPVSQARGEHGEFATLVPPAGDPHLRVQRLDAGPSGVHLDIHVDDLDAALARAEGLGARLVARPGHAVLRSPAGFPFCLVRERLAEPVGPSVWPDGHRSLADQLCLDVPPAAYDAECAFWAALLGVEVLDTTGSEFRRLDVPGPVQVLVQRLEEDEPVARGHVDVASDDRAAEVARLAALGARDAGVGDDWTVLDPPAGPVLCVTDRDPASGRHR